MDESYVFPPPLSLLCPPSNRISETTCLPTFSCLKDRNEDTPPSPSCSSNTASTSSNLSTPFLFPSPSFVSSQLSESKEVIEVISNSTNLPLLSTTKKEYQFNNSSSSSLTTKGSPFSTLKSLRTEELSLEQISHYQSIAKKLWEDSDSEMSLLWNDLEVNLIESISTSPIRKSNKATIHSNKSLEALSTVHSARNDSIKSSNAQETTTYTFSKNQRNNRNQNKGWANLIRTYKSKLKSSPDTWSTVENSKFCVHTATRPITPPLPSLLDGNSNEDAFSSWGGMALALWGEDCLRLEDLHYPGGLAGGKQTKESGIKLDEATIIQLGNSWDLFYSTYRLGLFNLSEMPPLPRGVPEFEYCPDATPTSLGVLYAPIPEWESVRLQSFHRMEIVKQDQQIRDRILDTLMEFKENLSKEFEIVLRYIGQDEIYRQSRNEILLEETLRRQSVCAHTILNRNMGMYVADLCADWRFALPEEDVNYHAYYQDSLELSIYGQYKFDLLLQDFRSYIGMPILAADGLPIGVLSVWGVYPGSKTSQLTNLVRQYARKIGALLEQNYCLKFITKVQKMKKVCLSLPRYKQLSPDQIRGINVIQALHSNKNQKSSRLFPIQTCINEKVFQESGLHVTMEDVEKLFSTFEQIEKVTNFETIYLASISLPWATSSEEKIDFLAYQTKVGEEKIKNLSYSFHERLFENMAEPYVVLQVCTRPTSRGSMDWEERGGWNEVYDKQCPFVHFSSFTTNQITDIAAGVVMAIKRNGKYGFILGVVSSCDDLVVGVEDLRFLQIIQTNLEEAFTRFTQQFQDRREFPFKGDRLSHLNERLSIDRQNDFPPENDDSESNKESKKRSTCLSEEQQNQKNLGSTRVFQKSQSSNPHHNRQATIIDSIMNTIEETSYEVRTQNGSSGDWTTKEEIHSVNPIVEANTTSRTTNTNQKIIDLKQQSFHFLNDQKENDFFSNSNKIGGLQPVPRRNRPRAFTTTQHTK